MSNLEYYATNALMHGIIRAFEALEVLEYASAYICSKLFRGMRFEGQKI